MAVPLEERRHDPFADVQARGSIDYMLRTTQQQLVDFSGQADLKASIVMTTSALLTSVAAARLEHEAVRWSLVTFMSGSSAQCRAPCSQSFPRSEADAHRACHPTRSSSGTSGQ